jgi:hypothetical protein
MKNLNDDKIQSLLEDKNFKNNPELNSYQLEDYKMYQQLFNIVGTKPKSALPLDFSKKVVSKIKYKQNRANNSAYYSLIGILSLFGIVVAVNIFNREFLFDLIHTIFKFKEIVTFCVASFFIIQYFDKKFIRLG